jgi:hypothetical protein
MSKPKKDKKEDFNEADLPEITPQICHLNILTKDSNIEKFLTSIKNTQRTFYKLVSRKEIVDFAKEKQLFIDPATMTDKQKKDPAFLDIPKELTPIVLAEAFSLFIAEQNLTARRWKKDVADA